MYWRLPVLWAPLAFLPLGAHGRREMSLSGDRRPALAPATGDGRPAPATGSRLGFRPLGTDGRLTFRVTASLPAVPDVRADFRALLAELYANYGLTAELW